MELGNATILIIIGLLIILGKFVGTWIVIKFVMTFAGSKKSSFVFTILYLIGKKEYKDIQEKTF